MKTDDCGKQVSVDLPLNGLRILDMANGREGMCGRLFADLGAEVCLVEPIGGVDARRNAPLVDGYSVDFAVHHANKMSVEIDLTDPQGQSELIAMAASVDMLIASFESADTVWPALRSILLARYPKLVVLSVSDFGLYGPYSQFVATDMVQMAMGGMLARSGLAGREPLMPPGELAAETAAINAAWCGMLGLWQLKQTGLGDHLDFSILESTAQILDPAFGVTGSAAAGRTLFEMIPRGRPKKTQLYPIFPCADGHVRICILNPRQWNGMSAWLGDNHEFSDPSYGNLGKRISVIKDVNALIAGLFADKSMADIVSEAQARGIPAASVDSMEEVLNNEHFNARGVFTEITLGNCRGRAPVGYLEVDSRHAGIRIPAPELGEHQDVVAQWSESRAEKFIGDQAQVHEHADKLRPFSGIRVLDLGVIVAGAEVGRIFADQGAEVIKVENKDFPDGLRQSMTGEPITQSFAQGQRGKQSLGMNLRTEAGISLFKSLVATADVVMSNFKPGTMESLGLGYEVLSEINPGIVMLDSSALGNSGPMSRTMGYGPLVRCTSGLTALWSYSDEAGSYSDGATIFPDHFAARVAAFGVAAKLLQRERSGRGGTVSVSQAESILAAMSGLFLRESIEPGTAKPMGNRKEFYAPSGVYPCKGDDEWCAIDVRSDAQWFSMCDALGLSALKNRRELKSNDERLRHRDEIDKAIRNWTAGHSPLEVLSILQSHGVAAGNVQRLNEYKENPHFIARDFFRELIQPGLTEPLTTENGPVKAVNLPDPDIRPAPFLAQHTRQVMKRVLDLSDEEIDSYVASGDLMELDTPLPS